MYTHNEYCLCTHKHTHDTHWLTEWKCDLSSQDVEEVCWSSAVGHLRGGEGKGGEGRGGREGGRGEEGGEGGREEGGREGGGRRREGDYTHIIIHTNMTTFNPPSPPPPKKKPPKN